MPALFAVHHCGAAEPELLSRGWRDTLEDAEALVLLRRYNATGKALRPPR
jgi:hypothetical protein